MKDRLMFPVFLAADSIGKAVDVQVRTGYVDRPSQEPKREENAEWLNWHEKRSAGYNIFL